MAVKFGHLWHRASDALPIYPYLCMVMSEPVFRFKQFNVRHDRCAMKVGTDGVLLGAWATVEGCRRILDIGTGTGLVALMAAQRATMAQVVGIEIDDEAVRQACDNVADSPFAARIAIVSADIRHYESDAPFDAILCNPPFFSEDTLPDSPSRALARHNALLSFEALLEAAVRLLSSDGLFTVILPHAECTRFTTEAFCRGLFLTRQCHVHTVSHKPPKRVLLTFSRSAPIATAPETLVLQNADGTRSEAYTTLTKDFYLW